MSDLSIQAKRKIVGRYPDWIKRFDIEDYYQNRPMIEKLYEERQLALATSLDHEETISKLSDEIQELKTQNQKLSMKLGENKRQSTLIFSLSLVAIILVSIGVNIVTDQPYTWVGWIMIGASVILQFIAFITLGQQD